MTSRLFDVRSTPAVNQFFDELPENEQTELGWVVTRLQLNPWPDDILKAAYGPLIAYDDGEWVVLYRVVGHEIQLVAGWNRRLGLPRGGPGAM